MLKKYNFRIIISNHKWTIIKKKTIRLWLEINKIQNEKQSLCLYWLKKSKLKFKTVWIQMSIDGFNLKFELSLLNICFKSNITLSYL